MTNTMSTWLNRKSFNIKDEYYTPPILVKPILEYIPVSSTIWCPYLVPFGKTIYVKRKAVGDKKR